MNEADERIVAHFSAIRSVTIELARRLPDELLARTGEGEEWTIGRTFLHIASGQCWWMNNVMRDGGGFVDEQAAAERAAILQALEKARDRMVSFFCSPQEDRMGKTHSHVRDGGEHLGRDVFLYLTAHEVHHVGRIAAALRQFGFEDMPFMPRHQPADRD